MGIASSLYGKSDRSSLANSVETSIVLEIEEFERCFDELFSDNKTGKFKLIATLVGGNIVRTERNFDVKNAIKWCERNIDLNVTKVEVIYI